MADHKVAQFLDDLRLVSPERHELVLALRQQILALDPAIHEEIKYGGILFGVDQHFCGVFSYTQHVSLEFGEGASLPDTHQLLQGSGKFRRHLKFSKVSEFADKHVMSYLTLAYAHSKNKHTHVSR